VNELCFHDTSIGDRRWWFGLLSEMAMMIDGALSTPRNGQAAMDGAKVHARNRKAIRFAVTQMY